MHVIAHRRQKVINYSFTALQAAKNRPLAR